MLSWFFMNLVLLAEYDWKIYHERQPTSRVQRGLLIPCRWFCRRLDSTANRCCHSTFALTMDVKSWTLGKERPSTHRHESKSQALTNLQIDDYTVILSLVRVTLV